MDWPQICTCNRLRRKDFISKNHAGLGIGIVIEENGIFGDISTKKWKLAGL